MKSTGECGICILAGGLSARMGRDKARLRLGRRSLLGHVRAAAQTLGLPVRTIRRDLVPRCGPLGGIYTGLKTSRATAELFLPCDMPFLSPGLLRKLLGRFRRHPQAVFVTVEGWAGFPLLLPRASLAVVERQIAKKEYSLQRLAEALHAQRLPADRHQAEVVNVNTPEDWRFIQERWKRRHLPQNAANGEQP